MVQKNQDQITVKKETKVELDNRRFKAQVNQGKRITWDEFLLEGTA